MMDLFSIQVELIRSRRAIRNYSDKKVPESLIRELLEASMWAPSAHNRQPWRFAVLNAARDKKKLAEVMGAKLREDRLADGDAAEAINRDVARSYARITRAPVVIIQFLTMVDMDHYPDMRRAQAEKTMACQSVAMAAQNFWLLAHSAGLGVCWLCAPLFLPQLVQETFNLPPDWEAQGLLTVGWPAESKEKTRRSWLENVRFFPDLD